MPNTLQRNLNLCFTKTKPEEEEHNHHHHHHQRHRRRRRQPPKPHHTGSLPTATKSILIKNFNTLYDPYQAPSSGDISGENNALSPDHDETAATPDFATVYASQRFFFSSPGRSNSIIESSSSSSLASTSSSSPPENEAVVGGGVAIPTFSPDPYMDFRRSMQEMVEARDLVDVRANWDYLHELLMCYLTLNPKSTHKFIVGAFADLLVSLMTAPPQRNGGRRDS